MMREFILRANVRNLIALLAIGLTALTVGAKELVIRVGYFPNVTHAQGVLGSDSTREGAGWFEERLGHEARIQWFPFNAGPSAMEAIFAGSIDLTYVGPNPALNAYLRSRGDEVRVLAGAAEGGAALVVPAQSTLREPRDFAGKRVATPQLGNTQDVAARVWLRSAGLRVTLTGGDVSVIPTANPDQLALFVNRKVDAVWTVEPWVSRLEREGGGRVLLEQRDAVTTVLVARAAFLREHGGLAARFLTAHRELTSWLQGNPAAAREKVRRALSTEVRREVPAELIERAWARLTFTDRISRPAWERLMADAQALGFVRQSVPLDRLFPAQP